MTRKVMSLFLLNFQGDLGQGQDFTVNLTIWPGDSPSLNMIAGADGRLPPAPDLIILYKAWKDAYGKYLNSYHDYLRIVGLSSTHNDPATFALKRRAVITNPDIEQAENQKQIDYNACVSCENQLIERFNQWLKSLESKDLKSPEFLSIVERLRHHLGQSKDAGHRILVQSNDPDLRKMPWTKWNLLNDFSRTEIGLSQLNFEKRDIKVNRQINKIRILAILGKPANIQGEIEKLAEDNNIDIIIVTNLPELDKPLWRESWDIIIFNGHSNTEHGTTGEFSLSETEKLTISKLRGHFNQAIERGLKLVIFNSCDGLGLAHQLGEGEKLYLSQVIVMRELLPAPVAPIFLGYFFEEFIKGVSLYEAMRLTKDRLLPLETQYPGISALPVICQNPVANTLHWFDLVIPPNPYQGLSAFQEKDAALFFGRETFTNQLVKVVETKKLVAVIGASGSGKSSVVLAGLIPSLRQQENWLIASLRPESTPFENLAKALLSPVVQLETGKSEGFAEVNGDEISQLATDLQEGNRTLSDVVKSIGSPRRFLLVIDQFEEIYTYPNQKNRHFLDCLLDAVQKFSAFRLVITLRADFLGQAIEYNPFREQLDRWKPEFIGGMVRTELQAAIEEPAKKRNVYLETGLTEHILNDVGEEQGNLPLLEFALTELWKDQENSLLTRLKYDEIGGVENALCRHAEGVYDALKEGDKERTKQIFMKLVSPGEGTEYTRQLATRAELGEENWDLVTHLATARLVVSNRNETTEIETVEIVHEALIKAWPDLRKWIEENDTFLRWKKRLKVAFLEWERNENKDGYLLQGAPLGEAEGYLLQRLEEISKAERVFIQLGLGWRDRNRRRTILGLTSGLLAVSIFAGGAFWQWQRAERQALINKVDSLSNLALNQFQSGEGGINALMIAMEAGQKLKLLVKQNEVLETYPTTTAVDALETIVKNIKEKNKFYTESGITRTIFTPDGSQIVGLNSLDGKMILWDLTGKKITEWQDPEEKEVFSLAMSPNGKYLASINEDKRLFIWDLSGKQIAIAKRGLIGFGTPEVKFTPDGDYIAVSSENDTVIFFDLSGHKVKELKTNSVVRTFEFTPNGQEIVTGNSRGFVQFWNLRTLEKIREFQVNKNLVLEIKFSPDAKQVLIRGADITSEKEWKQIVRLWDLSGQKIADLGIFSIIGEAYYGAVSFSPNGKQIAIVIPGDGRILLYDAKTGTLAQQIKVNALSGNLTYSPDGKTIVVSNVKQGINLLNINNSVNDTNLIEQNFIELPTKYEYESGDLKFRLPINLSYSSDGRKILVSSPGKFLDIWDWQKKQYIQQLNIGESFVKTQYNNKGFPAPNFANVTPDGKYIIFVNAQSVEKFDLAGNSISKVIADVPEGEVVLLTGDKNYSSSSDGNRIVTKGTKLNDAHEPVRFWDLSAKKVKKLENDHIPEMINSVAISPNGKYIFTTKYDLGKLWDTNGNLIAGSIDVKTQPSNSNKSVFTLGIVLNYEKENGNFYTKNDHYYSGWEILDVFPHSTAHQAGLKPGHIILAINDNKVSDINYKKFYDILKKKDQGNPVKLTVKTNREHYLTHKIEEKFIRREKITYDFDQFIVGNIGKFSPDSKYLASFYQPVQENTLQLRNLINKKLIKIDHQAKIIQANFSPNNQFIATTGLDSSVKIWDMSGKLINQIKLEQHANRLAFSPNSKMFAVLGYLNQLSIWGIDGKLIAKYTVPEEAQYQIVFSPDGKSVATAGRKVFIWPLGKDLDDLLNSGCDWLKEYFVTHPEEKQKLKVCQDYPKSK
jgi:WD40 repeat protein